MPNPDDRPLALQVVGQLRACGHFLYYRMGGRVGKRRILITLYERPGILQKDLQELLDIQSGSLSEMMIRLEADGYVEKVRRETDRRQWEVRLTQAGREEAARLKAAYRQRVERMMDCLTPAQQRELHDMLAALLEHWNEVGSSAFHTDERNDT